MPRKAPPKPRQRYVQWAVRTYLERYVAPKAHIRRLMRRKLQRCLDHHGGDREQVWAWIDEALDSAERAGLINDEQYLHDKVRSLVRKGNSSAQIVQKLYGKGLTSDQIRAEIAAVVDEGFDPQRIAAAVLMRRKGLGAFRRPGKEEDRTKELGKLGRAGFSYSLARELLELPLDELEELIFEKRRI